MKALCSAVALAAALLAGAAGIATAQDAGPYHIYLIVWRGEPTSNTAFEPTSTSAA